MADIPGAQFNITGASGTLGLLAPMSSWRAYILPRGGYASQASSGTLITFDSAATASRFYANAWIQSGLLTANIRQVSGVGGNSISISGSPLTVSKNDRIYLIGSTQPTISGGSATYTVPASFVYQRDDDTADLFTNSMVTSNADGLVQFFSQPNVYDVILQDGNQGNQGSIIDLVVGSSISTVAVFGSTVTFNAAIGVTGSAQFGNSVGITGALGVTGWATFGATVTVNGALGVTGTATVGATLTVSGAGAFGSTLTVTGPTVLGASGVLGGLSITTGIFGCTNQPRALLFGSSGLWSVFSAGNTASITWDSEAYDVGGMHSGSSSHLTVPVGAGGTYLLSSAIICTVTGGGGNPVLILEMIKNGNTVVARSTLTDSGTSNTLYATTIDNTVAGDYYEIYVARAGTGGTSLTTYMGDRSYSRFSAAKLF